MKYLPVHFRLEQVSGLIIVAAIALGVAAKNSPLAPLYDVSHHATVHIGIGSWTSDEPVILWVNEGLMVFFFLLVGTELKRELLEGHLSTLRQASLPAYAAIGGMMVPALIYVALTWVDPTSVRGWAIPTATDIVLALGVLSLLGRRVPVPLKAFLMALAIFDDIGAVLIIGLFYGNGLVFTPLVVVALAVGGLWLLNRHAIARVWPYVAIGGALWVAMLNSGLEAALAGVLIGAAIPMRAPSYIDSSPLRHVEQALTPWVALVIVPMFAFFNSGVVIDIRAVEALATPISLGIILGLFLGKPLGIMGAVWLATQLGVARLPHGTTWLQMHGVAIIAGIGFTMSLFVATLAFTAPEMVMNAKLAVLTGSFFSALTGLLILHIATRAR
ncbi:MAG: Na+/H+ antiporter NhaA [Pseudomonadota bacterium]